MASFTSGPSWICYWRRTSECNSLCRVPADKAKSKMVRIDKQTLINETVPNKMKTFCAFSVVLLDCFWALGACFEVVLAMAVVPNLGWRWLLGLSAAPLFVFACLTPWLPESARYHVSCGQNDKALATLETVSSLGTEADFFFMII